MLIQRIPKNVPSTLTFVALNDADVATDVGSVTIGVVDDTGATVVASGTGTTGAGGTYTYALAARATLGVLVATWTASGGRSWETVHEVVSQRYASISEIRDSHDELVAGGDFSDVQVARARDAVELEFERITGLSFARRRGLFVLSGSGTTVLQTPVRYVRRVVSGSVYDRIGGTATALTTAQITAIALDDEAPPGSCTGLLVLTDGAVWPAGRRNLSLTLEYGYDAPPRDVWAAVLRTAYWRLHNRNTEVLDQATALSAAGTTFSLDRASATSTGIPAVDAVLGPYSDRGRDGLRGPASGSLRLSRNRAGSLFHR